MSYRVRAVEADSAAGALIGGAAADETGLIPPWECSIQEKPDELSRSGG